MQFQEREIQKKEGCKRLNPVECHAQLRALYQMLPASPYERFERAVGDRLSVMTESLETLIATEDPGKALAILQADPRSHVNIKELKEEGRQEEEKRTKSEFKERFINKVRKLVSLAPISEGFKAFVVDFFEDSYISGATPIKSSWNYLQFAILRYFADSGGFFNPKYAFALERFSYKKESKSILALNVGPHPFELFNGIVEAVSGQREEDPILLRARVENDRQKPRNLRRLARIKEWRQQFIDYYHIEP